MNNPLKSLLASLLSAVAAAVPASCATDAGSPPGPQDSPSLAALRAAGLDAEVAVFPVRLLGAPDRDVGDALGLLLEKRGMTKLSSAGEFAPTAEDWDSVVAQLAARVREHPPAARYALYAEFLGTPATGPTEVRFAVVDSHGEVVLKDQQTPADSAFRRALSKHPEPMTCCAFVAERFAERVALPRAGQVAGGGTFAELWAAKSGLPSEVERAAMQARLDALREATKPRFVVLPSRVGDRTDADSAARLAAKLHERLGWTAEAAASAPAIQLAPTRNEQKALWSFAKAVRAHVAESRVDADYVLMADYRVDAERGERGAVHLVLSDRAGELVWVDLQNSHHRDYGRVMPRSVAACDEVAVERLVSQLR
jgi:hypothetical protein